MTIKLILINYNHIQKNLKYSSIQFNSKKKKKKKRRGIHIKKIKTKTKDRSEGMKHKAEVSKKK